MSDSLELSVFSVMIEMSVQKPLDFSKFFLVQKRKDVWLFFKAKSVA